MTGHLFAAALATVMTAKVFTDRQPYQFLPSDSPRRLGGQTRKSFGDEYEVVVQGEGPRPLEAEGESYRRSWDVDGRTGRKGSLSAVREERKLICWVNLLLYFIGA